MDQHFSNALIICCAIVVMFAFIVLAIVPYWQIFKKAGFPAPLALLMFVPLANIVILYVVAFSEWKVVPRAATYPAPFPPPPPVYPPQA